MPQQADIVFRAGELAAVAGGHLHRGRPDTELGRFAIDSRRVRPGDVFVAIRGARFDGHRFVAEALGRGAAGAVVAHASALPSDAGPHAWVVVDDTVAALQRIAQAVRRRSGARVVAITGSVGKTTTKELTAALLGTRYRVLRNEGNLNNHIGLPLSLLELRRRPEAAVVELGMNHAGEISTLVRIAEPDFRVWTNVAEVHAAFFESVDAIADAKAEILEGATPETELVVNAADRRAMARVARFPGRTTTFGVTGDAEVRAVEVTDLGLDGSRSRIETPAGGGTLRMRLIGPGHVANALAAIAVALRFGVPLETILSTAATFRAQPRRGEVLRLGAGVTVVDDSYNSSPAALRSTLQSVGGDRTDARRVAVLGEMLELGARAEALHRACGAAAVEAGFTHIVAIGGAPAVALAAGAVTAGLPSSAVTTWGTSAEAEPAVSALVQAGDLVLVKGSRGVAADRIVDRLRVDWA